MMRWIVCILFTGCVAADVPLDATDSMCGEHTVASVAMPTGNRLVMCAFEDGTEVIAEGGDADPVERSNACALDVVAVTEDNTPIPRRLIDSCATRTGTRATVPRPIVDGAVAADAAAGSALFATTSSSNYCGLEGQQRFASEHCINTCGGDPNCTQWCHSDLVYKHEVTTSAYVGEQVNHAWSRVASCGGTTKFRGLRDRGAADPGWVALVEVNVASETSWAISMSYAPSSGADAHFAFTGSWITTAARLHRYAGRFLDDK